MGSGRSMKLVTRYVLSYLFISFLNPSSPFCLLYFPHLVFLWKQMRNFRDFLLPPFPTEADANFQARPLFKASAIRIFKVNASLLLAIGRLGVHTLLLVSIKDFYLRIGFFLNHLQGRIPPYGVSKSELSGSERIRIRARSLHP